MAYLDDLPALAAGILEYQALGGAVDPILSDLSSRIAAFPLQVLPQQAQGALLERWEKMTGLSSGGSLEQRRFRLISRLASLRPYTLEQLRRQLAAAFGREDGFSVTLDAEAFSLSVEVDKAGEAVLADLTAELRRMIPANLTLHTGVGQSEELALFTGIKMQVTAAIRL